MWNFELKRIAPQTLASEVVAGEVPVSFGQAIDLLKDSGEFRSTLTEALAASEFEAFFWETPPVTAETLDRPFEYVLVEARALGASRPDPTPFQSQFEACPGEAVVTFPNLGGDAVLIVPAPVAGWSSYTHLAAFLRQAPREQVDALWRSVGAAMAHRVSARPTWLSTAGMGVSWLHLRLDSRPKYYRHAAYRNEA